MAQYSGKMTLNFWAEAEAPEEVEARINKMLDDWNLATSDDVHWDDVDWTIEKEND